MTGRYVLGRPGGFYHPSAVTDAARRESPGRPPLGVSPDVHLNWPIELECALRREVTAWRSGDLVNEAIALLRRHRQIEKAFEAGDVTDDDLDQHKRWFIREGRLLIRLNAWVIAKDREAFGPARSQREQSRRTEWLRTERLKADQAEQQRQRRLLREGARTMTGIRRVLRGQAPLQPPESTQARSLPI